MEFIVKLTMDGVLGKKRNTTIEKLKNEAMIVLTRINEIYREFNYSYNDSWRSSIIEVYVEINDDVAIKAPKLWQNKKDVYNVGVDKGEFQRLLLPVYSINKINRDVTVSFIIDYKELLVAWARSGFSNRITSYILTGYTKKLRQIDYYNNDSAISSFANYINHFSENSIE